MAGIIRITPEEVKSAARRIGQKTTETTNFLNNIQTEITNLQSIWEGNAAQAYVEQFQALRKELETKLNQCLADLQKSLESVAQALDQADKDVASKLRSGK
ncbi:WXG100 family type VII secretion target [Acetivibrio mesophilus]|jgi:WXG100 family type VII secretion target|uniref:ESAT-6-like protein n=1 Tax=Acetivibrio mesophilus TaxID=2487273 RepID=A0A4Q0I6V9_9FIRM|nr:WXG100 family type VII secretion target [Acetivibrio mesophilus]ODM25549.1 hypothetical protein A7W90_04545 [Clostridium sp. Bc-iso-3]RXE60134.1 WXG100 family type VII secretion target [Acetivibrio mesophilus]HHV29109.1 WXG100 family type VII secretion target [Clostridium sp.]